MSSISTQEVVEYASIMESACRHGQLLCLLTKEITIIIITDQTYFSE